MDRIQSLGLIMAGIGLIIFGFKLLRNHSKALYSRKLRLLLDNLTNNKIKSLLIGLVSGLVMPNAATFALTQAGASSSGLIDDKKILTVIFWMNAGCSLLVWFSAFNLSYFIAFFLGLTAITLVFVKDAKWQIRLEFALSIFIIFFALQLIRAGSSELFTADEIKSFISQHSGSVFISFFLGTILTILTQSSLLITMIAISMTNSGIFDLPQLVIFIYGTELGIGVLIFIVSVKIRGKAKRVMMGQIIFEIIGVFIFVLLFLIELFTQIPLVMNWMSSSSNDIAHQIANTYVLFNFSTAVICTLLINIIYKFIAKLHPVTDEESRLSLKFISDMKGFDPITGMEMVYKELQYSLKEFDRYFDFLDSVSDKKNKENFEKLRFPFQIIYKEIEEVIKNISSELLTRKESERILFLQRISELTKNIEEELSLLISKSIEIKDNKEAEKIMTIIIESARTIWLSFTDMIKYPSKSNIQTILMLSSDKSDILNKFRLNNAEAMISLNKSGKSFELDLHFESLIWLINKYTRMIEADSN